MIYTRKEYKEKYLKIKEDYLTGNYLLYELSEKYNIKYPAISKFLKKEGFIINSNNKFPINDNIFEEINTPEKAYWLGFLYADGYIGLRKKQNTYTYSIELSLKKSDLDHIESFKKFLNSFHKINYREKLKAYRFVFSSRKIGEDLIKLGCIQNKSLILKFPTEEQVPKYLINHFIRGYFDGDGCINDPEKYPITLSLMGTFEFLKELLKQMNIETKIRKTKSKAFDFAISGDKARLFLKNLYENNNICLERKYNRFIKHLENIKNYNGRKK